MGDSKGLCIISRLASFFVGIVYVVYISDLRLRYVFGDDWGWFPYISWEHVLTPYLSRLSETLLVRVETFYGNLSLICLFCATICAPIWAENL